MIDPILIAVIVAVVSVATAMLIHGHKVKTDRDAANKAADIAAAEAWKTDYHNPDSPTYDPERVAKEEAEFLKTLNNGG